MRSKWHGDEADDVLRFQLVTWSGDWAENVEEAGEDANSTRNWSE